MKCLDFRASQGKTGCPFCGSQPDRLGRFLPASLLSKRRSVIAARARAAALPAYVSTGSSTSDGQSVSAAPSLPPTFGDNATSASVRRIRSDRRRLLPATKKCSPPTDHRRDGMAMAGPLIAIALCCCCRLAFCCSYKAGDVSAARNTQRVKRGLRAGDAAQETRQWDTGAADLISQTTCRRFQWKREIAFCGNTRRHTDNERGEGDR